MHSCLRFNSYLAKIFRSAKANKALPGLQVSSLRLLHSEVELRVFRSGLRRRFDSRWQQRVKIENNTYKSEGSSDADEQQKGHRLFPEQADDLNDDAEDQKHTGYAQGSLDLDFFHGYCPGVQNFTLDCSFTLWTVSWQPLEMQDISLLMSWSLIAVCTALLSNDRAPAWQCRHSRLL